ncbi:MAG TPA: hypothetical protein VHT91_47075 [Kofleriaceae bacterium]|nr:hypothetical protein [Kofleriaceae bacterium]
MAGADDQLRPLAMERQRSIDCRAQPIDRVRLVADPGNHSLGQGMIQRLEHRVEHCAEVREIEVQGGAFDPQRVGELSHRGLRAPGAHHLTGSSRQLDAACQVPAASHILTLCQYKAHPGPVNRGSGEELPSGARNKAVQRGAHQTVGMGHHAQAPLVYAGSISWK